VVSTLVNPRNMYTPAFDVGRAWQILPATSCCLPGHIARHVILLARSYYPPHHLNQETGVLNALDDVAGNVCMSLNMGAVALLLCAVGARALWYDRPASSSSSSGHSRSGSALGSQVDDLSAAGGDAAAAEAAAAEEAGRAAAAAGLGQEKGIWSAAKMVFANSELLSLGVTNSLYEAALHVFVFVWTPALERRGPKLTSEGGVLVGGDAAAGGVDYASGQVNDPLTTT
jgi:hypothetical protein